MASLNFSQHPQTTLQQHIPLQNNSYWFLCCTTQALLLTSTTLHLKNTSFCCTSFHPDQVNVTRVDVDTGSAGVFNTRKVAPLSNARPSVLDENGQVTCNKVRSTLPCVGSGLSQLDQENVKAAGKWSSVSS